MIKDEVREYIRLHDDVMKTLQGLYGPNELHVIGEVFWAGLQETLKKNLSEEVHKIILDEGLRTDAEVYSLDNYRRRALSSLYNRFHSDYSNKSV